MLKKSISTVWLFIWIFVIGLVLSTIRVLAIPDEGRYGDISRWMVQSHDWIVPRLNGLPFFHKPPLLHWLSGVMLEIFGQHNWVLRLVPLLAGMLMLVTMYRFAVTYMSQGIGRLAVLILASSMMFFGAAQYVNHDLLLAAWISVAVFSIAHAAMTGHRASLMLGYAALGFGFLTKGLIGILIPGMILLPWILFTGQWRVIIKLLHPLGLGLLLLIVMPWLYTMSQRYPEFWHYFFIEQQFSRFSSTEFNNKQPWFFYIACLVVNFLPWLVLIRYKSLFHDWLATKTTHLNQYRAISLCVWWVISCLIFFSIPPSKLVGYILPLMAPLSLLLSLALQRTFWHNLNQSLSDSISQKSAGLMRRGYFAPAYVLFIAFALGVSYCIHQFKKPFITHDASSLPIIAAILMLIAGLGFYLLYKKRATVVAVTVLMTSSICLSLPFSYNILEKRSNQPVASFAHHIPAGATVVFYHTFLFDIPWIIRQQQPAYVVYDWDKVNSDNTYKQLKDGTRFEPQLRQYLINDQQFEQLIQQRRPVVIFANPRQPLQSLPPHYQFKVYDYPNFRLYVLL